MSAFTVGRKTLAPALARAAAIVPNHSTIAILLCLRLETSNEGLFVTATDTDVVYRERVDDVARESWRGCVDAARLEAFVAGCPADSDVVLRADDEARLRVACGRASCRLPTLPAEDFPLFDRSSEGAVELTLDAPALAGALKAVAPAMATEKARYYLNGAFLHSGKLCTTDGHRLALRTVATATPAAPEIIVPAAAVTRLLALLRGVDGQLSVCVSPRQIVVGALNWILTSKLIDGIFPDYRRVLPERSPSPLLVRRKALRDAAALVAAVHHGDKSRGLRLSVTGGELLVASSGSDALGACEVTIAIEGEPSAAAWMTGLNHDFLLVALDALDGELVELHVAREQWAPVWFCVPGEAHDGWVVVPMRV